MVMKNAYQLSMFILINPKYHLYNSVNNNVTRCPLNQFEKGKEKIYFCNLKYQRYLVGILNDDIKCLKEVIW